MKHPNQISLLLVCATTSCVPVDRVAVTNTPKAPERVGLLVDGWRNGQQIDDEAYTPKLPPQGVPNLDGTGEVIAFGERRAVSVKPASWTPQPEDRVELALEQAYKLPITVWIVDADVAEQKERMQNAVSATNAIWDAERAGIRIGGMQVIDATAKATAELSDFACSERKALTQAIGRKPGRINLYVVQRVEGKASRVTVCGGGGFGVIGHGAFAGDVTFALTANFGLKDVQQYGPKFVFDERNVMHPDHGPRQYLTEGQIFRMHVNPQSALNSVYGVRTGKTVRNCFAPAGSSQCPALDRRVWPDGNLPAN